MRERLRGAAPAALTFVIGLWLTSGAWGSRPPSGDDVMAIIVRSQEGLRVLSSFHLDGWSPRFLAGFPIFLHYGPGLSVATGLVRVLSLGLVSHAGAIQVLFAASFAAVAPATWFLARSIGMSVRAATFAGIFVLAVNSPFGVGLQGLYVIGLLPHALAAPLLLVGLGATVRVVRERRRRWIALMASCFGLVVVTHVISTVIAAVFVVIFTAAALIALPTWAVRRDALLRVAIGGAGAAGLSAVWFLPYMVHFHHRGSPPSWATDSLPHRLDEIIAGHFVLGHYLALFVVAGWAWAVLHGRVNRLAVVPPLAAFVFVFGAHWYFNQSPTAELAQQLANRGIGYATVLAFVPLGGFLDDALPRRLGPPLRFALGAIVALVVIVVVPGKPGLRSVPKQLGEPTPVARSTAAFLKRVVPDGARFSVERDLPGETTTIGMTHADFWLAAASGRNTANTFNLELSQSGGAGSLGENLKGDTAGQITARRFARFGVTHVVTLEPTARDRLLATGEFEQRFTDGPVAVLAVRPPDGVPRPSSLFSSAANATADQVTVSDDAEHYDIDVNVEDRAVATVALGYSSYWRVKVDGRSVPVQKSPDGLLGFVVPQGEHRVSVDYERDPWNAIGLLISLSTVAGFVLWSRRPSRLAQVPAAS